MDISAGGQIGKEGSMRYEEIKQLIDLFEETDLAEMELTRENDGLRLVRGNGGKAASQQVLPVQPEIPEAPSLSDLQDIVASVQNGAREAMAGGSAPAAAQRKCSCDAMEEGSVVTAPIVGTFYAKPAQDKDPFVKVGDTVAEGDTLCIIEAMKFMNEVPSTVGGTIKEVLVQDGDFVEFGQPLFRIG